MIKSICCHPRAWMSSRILSHLQILNYCSNPIIVQIAPSSFLLLRFGYSLEPILSGLGFLLPSSCPFSASPPSLPLWFETGRALSNRPYMDWRQKVPKHSHQSLCTVYIHLQLHHHSSWTNSTSPGYIMTGKHRERWGRVWKWEHKLVIVH